MMMTDQQPAGSQEFRSGFVCFVGRPNAGKSTLTNALVGSKIAITSSKPQTTRHAVRGVLHRADGQLIIIDTPGLSKPRSLLQQRLNDLVRSTWSEVDVVALVFPADEHIGPGDVYLATQLAELAKPPTLVAIVTKTDLVSPERLAKHLLRVARLQDDLAITFAHILPCSARSGSQVGEVADVLLSLMPPGPDYYPDGEITDEPDETLVAELIREAALEEVRDELPHSIAVEVDEMMLRDGRPIDRPLVDIFASMIVERDSQRGIMVGHAGERIKRIGVRARRQIRALLGTQVHLDLRVKVVKDWQRDAKQLNRLGF
ncbi:GTPase Era [Propionibacterium freudenreichii]|uniref:GTPase Era n=1 Tax=Propionibacterium freudenreichii TaxID=1744 RepID=UPI000543D7D6|nr:GTPase Era [Propionibacterium freudenreichii]MDN5962001.1 GTPase Era [Propionibacterium sp.]WBF60541.1 GTPase Era [Propionibacterium freudenreichii]WBF64992.1 GTPase Era [Propionibacterium freudenreichii]CEH10486.1 GTP-binding protein [Propionibacterium freudenreichii]